MKNDKAVSFFSVEKHLFFVNKMTADAFGVTD